MRIMLAPSAYYPHVGGIEELTRQLALTLESRGHDVSVLTNRWPAGVARHEVLGGVDVTRLAFPLPAARPRNAARFLVAAPGAALALLRHLRGRKPDVIHIIGAGPQSVYIGALAPLLHARLVFTAQGEFTFDAHNVFERSATMRAGLRRVLRRADAVTACSAYVLESLTTLGTIRTDTIVIPNGVNTDDFASSPRQLSERPYVLAVGRLVPQKGFDVLVEALAYPDLTQLDLVVAGDGPGARERRGSGSRTGTRRPRTFSLRFRPAGVGRHARRRAAVRVSVARRAVRNCIARGDGRGRSVGGDACGRSGRVRRGQREHTPRRSRRRRCSGPCTRGATRSATIRNGSAPSAITPIETPCPTRTLEREGFILRDSAPSCSITPR
jgi:glycogen synthase